MTRATSIFKPGRIFLWATDISKPIYEIWIDDEEVTDYCTKVSVPLRATDGISSANIDLDNGYGRFTNKYTGGEIVEVWATYEAPINKTTSTDLLFRGTLVNNYFNLASTSEFSLRLECQDYPEFVKKKIIIQFVNKNIIDAFKGTGFVQDSQGNGDDSILYNTGLTLQFYDIDIVDWTTTITDNIRSRYADETVTASYENRSILSIAQDLAKRGDFDFYLYYDVATTTWYLRLFPTGSLINAIERFSQGVNITGLNNLGKNRDMIYNKATVYGKTNDNIVIMKTEEDTNSQADLWESHEVIQDTSLDTQNEVNERANFELSKGIETPQVGSVSAIGAKTIKPGEKALFAIQYCELAGYYTCREVVHDLVPGWETSVTVSKINNQIANLFNQRIKDTENLREYANLNAMENSHTIHFNEVPSLMTHANTEEANGVLKLKSGLSAGTARTKVHIADANMSQVELRVISNLNYETDVFRVSNNNGLKFDTINLGVVHTFTTTGNKLIVEIQINSTSSKYDALCVLYK